jgi:hypothetical protein
MKYSPVYPSLSSYIVKDRVVNVLQNHLSIQDIVGEQNTIP